METAPFIQYLDEHQVFPAFLPWPRPSVAEVPAVLPAALRVMSKVFPPALPGVAEVLRNVSHKQLIGYLLVILAVEIVQTILLNEWTDNAVVAFIIQLVLFLIANSSTAMIGSVVSGLVGIFPQRYTTAHMIGQGLSFIFTSVALLISMTVFAYLLLAVSDTFGRIMPVDKVNIAGEMVNLFSVYGSILGFLAFVSFLPTLAHLLEGGFPFYHDSDETQMLPLTSLPGVAEVSGKHLEAVRLTLELLPAALPGVEEVLPSRIL
ncbi:S29A1 protein, partial [Polypterus senegalus]